MKQTLINREFLGLVLKEPDPKHQGRYLVHIHELMPHIKEDQGIFVKNQTHNYRVTPSEKGIYGSYYPLQPGTKVVIKFHANDINSGYIDRTISDYEKETLPLKTVDRDDLYQIIRTPKKNNLIAITEETTDLPPNAIHIYFNDKRTTIVVDEEGIHIKVSQDNFDMYVKKNENVQIDGDSLKSITGKEDIKITGDSLLSVTGNRDSKITGNDLLTVKGNQEISIKGDGGVYIKGAANIKVVGDCSIDATGHLSILSSSMVSIDAPAIALNSGSSKPAKPPAGGQGGQGATVPPQEEGSDKSSSSKTTVVKLDDYQFFKRSE